MDRRVALAIGLMLIVAVLPSLLFSPERPEVPVESMPSADSLSQADSTESTEPVANAAPAVPQTTPEEITAPMAEQPDADAGAEQLVVVESDLYRYVFSSRGVRLVSATPKRYRSFAPGESGPAQLIPEESHFLVYDLVVGRDTVSLADWEFEPSRSRLDVTSYGTELEWVARRNSATVRIKQTFVPDEYMFDVEGDFSGIAMDAGLMLLNLGPRLRLVEADSVWDFRN